jgi:hypothetical protein
LAAPACGAIDSNISAADSVTISIRMIWLPSPLTSAKCAIGTAAKAIAQSKKTAMLTVVRELAEQIDDLIDDVIG